MIFTLYIPPKVFVIAKNGNPIYCKGNQKKYLYGFQSNYLANHACSFIDSIPEIYCNPLDVSSDVNTNLQKWGLKQKIKDVKVDTEGRVKLNRHFDKSFTINSVRYVDFLSETFEYNNGIALVTEIANETDYDVEYKVQYVEPSPQDEDILESLGFLIPLWRHYGFH